MSYGLLAQFHSAAALLQAAHRAHQEGYRRLDAFTPFPVEGLAEALGLRPTRLPVLVLLGSLLGGTVGYSLQYWVNLDVYPLNVGGRPLHSWPAFVIATFELTVLFGAFTCLLGMFALNGLPMPYHPVFNVPNFSFAERDRFFLLIAASDPNFDPDRTRRFLQSLSPAEVVDVPE